MDNFGREDKTNFETLKELLRYLGDRCYHKWNLQIIMHSNGLGQLYDNVLQFYRQTEERVAQLNSVDPRFRIV